MDTKIKNKIAERFSFCAFSTSPQSGKWPLIRQPTDDAARPSRAMILGLAVWIFATVSVFAESYPNRPTEYEMEGIVILGKECVLGVNERCQAAQVSPPFVKTNSAGWYLDQSAMETIASTARSLVPYYANPDTVYNGTMNITMLTVAGVWDELEIGDHENQFTQTFASGTNAAVYGDAPWRIYQENLDERYNVLNALEKRRWGSYGGTSFPEVVTTASVWGEGNTQAGYCHVWYSLGGDDLGVADGTKHDVEIDARGVNGASGYDYISFGVGSEALPGEMMQFKLDTAFGEDYPVFFAGIELKADPSIITILNCLHGDGGSNLAFSYAISSATMSAKLNRNIQEQAIFGVLGVITFPFQYCE